MIPTPYAGRPTVVVIDDWDGACRSSAALQHLAQFVNLTVHEDRITGHALLDRLQDADIVVPIRERTTFDAKVLEALPKLKLIAQTGGGAAHIDTAAAERLGVQIAFTPGASARAVAELCLGLMLALYRRIPQCDRSVRDGGWDPVIGYELSGRRLGILGFGNTGSAFAELAINLGMRVTAWSRSLVPGDATGAITVAESLEEVLASADVVSLHIALTPQTQGIMNYGTLRQMRSGSFLINTARGELVVEDDLVQVLGTGPLAGAGLDVFASEPPVDNPLLQMPNVVVTPHLGWRTAETLERFFRGVSENVLAFLQVGNHIDRQSEVLEKDGSDLGGNGS